LKKNGQKSEYSLQMYIIIKKPTYRCFSVHSGNLLTRNLGDIVRKEDFVLDSEYLQTLIVVIPR